MRDEELATMTSGTTPPLITTPNPPATLTGKIDLSPIFNIPGVVWIGLIAAITKWVSDSFPDQPWAPAVVIVLGMIAKLIQIYWPKGDAAPVPPAPSPAAAAAPIPLDGDDYTYVGYIKTPKESAGRRFARLLVG